MSKKDPIFNLKKIPDNAYIKVLETTIKELQVKAGQDASYILELEHKLKVLLELDENHIKKLKEDTIYNKYTKTIKTQKKKIKEYIKTQKRLIGELMELKNGK